VRLLRGGDADVRSRQSPMVLADVRHVVGQIGDGFRTVAKVGDRPPDAALSCPVSPRVAA
jgi:hypothetical protein